MSDFEPSTESVRAMYVKGVAQAYPGSDAYAEFNVWLATVTPNPDDTRQVETVARTLHDREWPTCEVDEIDHMGDYQVAARAVLAALAEAVA